MKFIFDEVLRVFRKNRLLSLLTVLLVVLCICFFSYVADSFDIETGTLTVRENERFMEYTVFRFDETDHSLFIIPDSRYPGGGYGYDPFINEDMTAEEVYGYCVTMESMKKEIAENCFDGYAVTSTHVAIPFSDIDEDETLVRGVSVYGSRAMVHIPEYYTEAGYVPVECYKVDVGFLKNNNIIMAKGRLFDESDYEWTQSEPLPVVLGYNFADYYDIGDIITTYDCMKYGGTEDYDGTYAPLKVVGILEKDTVVYTPFVGSAETILANIDSYVIVPEIIPDFHDCDPNDRSSLYKIGLLTNNQLFKSSGFFYERENVSQGTEKLYEILEKYGFSGFYRVSNSDYNINLSVAITTERQYSFTVMAILVAFFTVCSVIATELNKLETCRKAYAVYSLTGMTKDGMSLFAMFDMLVTFIIAFILSHFPLVVLLFPDLFSGTRIASVVRSVFGNGTFYLTSICLCVLLVALSGLLCRISFAKAETVSLIKGE